MNIFYARFVVAITVLATALFSSPTGRAQDIRAGALSIIEPYVRATPPTARIGAGYVKIENTGAYADHLIGVESPAAKSVEIHSSSVEGGIAKMRHLSDGLPIPAGAITALAPGGFHLMFIEPRMPFRANEGITAVLVFRAAGRVAVTFPVRPMGQ